LDRTEKQRGKSFSEKCAKHAFLLHTGRTREKKSRLFQCIDFSPPALRAPKGREKEGEGGPCVVYQFPRRREAQSAGLPDVLAQMPFGRSMHPDVEGEVTSL
jgi:hypothetical protein